MEYKRRVWKILKTKLKLLDTILRATKSPKSLETLKQGKQVKKRGFGKINQISHKKGFPRLGEERANRR